MRVFLDANILFSASAPESATRAVLNAILTHATAVTNRHAWEEARRNLEYKRPGQVAELQRLESQIEMTGLFAPVVGISLPDKDQPVLGSAVASRCTHLWTSDRRHFGALYGKTVGGTKVASSIALADELLLRGWLK
jgi:hypothetical protein